MRGSFLEAEPRNFNPVSVPGLTNEAREAVNAALKAMSTWRNEIADSSERNGKRVMERMATAASAIGWPEQIVDGARTQMQSIADMQIKTMDKMLDAWEEQFKLPTPTTASPSSTVSKLDAFPGFAPVGSFASVEAFQKAAMNPFQLWMELAQQWQKSWTVAMTTWGKAAKLH